MYALGEECGCNPAAIIGLIWLCLLPKAYTVLHMERTLQCNAIKCSAVQWYIHSMALESTVVV